jgi:PAS domain S-box-containing protein
LIVAANETSLPTAIGIGTAIGSVVTAVVTAVGTLFMKWYLNRRNFDAKEKADALGHFKALVDHHEKTIEILRTEHVAIRKEAHECHVAREQLQGQLQLERQAREYEVKILQSQIRQLQIVTGTPSPTPAPVIVIAGADGLIRSVSPSVGPMLHWEPKALVRKPIDLLIPERYREAHRAAMAKMISSGLPPTSSPIVGEALTSDGQEVPVSVSLWSWTTDKGDLLVAADIRQRPGLPRAAGGPGTPNVGE